MERYDYRQALYEDIQEYIKDNGIDVTCEDVADTLHDDLWIEDSVTGNGSGSYFCNTWAAEEALCHNWDLIQEVVTEFGFGFIKKGGAEALDVGIRCYLLGEVIGKVLEDMRNDTSTDKEGIQAAH